MTQKNDIVFHSKDSYLIQDDISTTSKKATVYTNNAYLESIYWTLEHTDGTLIQNIDYYNKNFKVSTRLVVGATEFNITKGHVNIRGMSLMTVNIFLNDNMFDYLGVILWVSDNVSLTLLNEQIAHTMTEAFLGSVVSMVQGIPLTLVTGTASVISLFKKSSNSVAPV